MYQKVFSPKDSLPTSMALNAPLSAPPFPIPDSKQTAPCWLSSDKMVQQDRCHVSRPRPERTLPSAQNSPASACPSQNHLLSRQTGLPAALSLDREAVSSFNGAESITKALTLTSERKGATS